MSRAACRATYQLVVNNYSESRAANTTGCRHEVVCQECSRKFKRESARKRHKCIAERQKPIQQQRGVGQFSVRTATNGSGARVGWQFTDVLDQEPDTN